MTKTARFKGKYQEVCDFLLIHSQYLSVFIADLRLAVPSRNGFTPDQRTLRRIAKFFPVLVPENNKNAITIHNFEAIIPKSLARWGKLQILNGGDHIRGLDTSSVESIAEKRDNSFVRVSCSPFHQNFSDMNVVHLVSGQKPG